MRIILIKAEREIPRIHSTRVIELEFLQFEFTGSFKLYP